MPGSIIGSMSFSGDVIPADGAITNAKISSSAEIVRSKLALESAAKYIVPWSAFRVHNAIETLPPQPAADDDLGWPATQTRGTVSPYLETKDLKTLSTTVTTRFQFALPTEYANGETVTLQIRAGMKTNSADGSCNADAAVYKADRDGGVGADICATAAQSMNNLANADLSFTITPTGLVSGDVLDVFIDVIVVDTATGTAVIGEILEVALLLDIRG